MLQGLIDGSRRLPCSELVQIPGPVSREGRARMLRRGLRMGRAGACGLPAARWQLSQRAMQALPYLRAASPAPPLPPLLGQVQCPGGCEERYCSAECAAAAWERHHCLLCPVGACEAPCSSAGGGRGSVGGGKGKGKVPAARGRAGALDRAPPRSGGASVGGAGVSGQRRGGSGSGRSEEVVCGVQLRRGRLGGFLEHADESNDMLRLAAQVRQRLRRRCMPRRRRRAAHSLARPQLLPARLLPCGGLLRRRFGGAAGPPGRWHTPPPRRC